MPTAVPVEFAVLLAVALTVSALGFYRFVYFISLGYGFSVTAMALVAAVLFRNTLGAWTALQCALLAAYGLRLGIFLLVRERQAAYRRREVPHADGRVDKMPLGRKLIVWPSVSLLYVFMFSPCLFNLDTQAALGPAFRPWILPIGLAIMAFGLALEAVADWQKSAHKKQYPERFCDAGLYQWVRCPNYLGEIVFWVGGFAAGMGAYSGWLRWAIALIGLVCIVLIMMGSTKRLERSQQERYGDQPAFQEYVRTVPVLFPYVPVYSLQNVRVFLE